MFIRNLIVAVALFALPGRLEAAPQILGLVASVEATPMTCENGTCFAEFSTFCLQEQREIPVDGTEYLATVETAFSMSFKDISGNAREVSVADKVRIISNNGYASVTISIPEHDLILIGAQNASLSVGKLGSLVPAKKIGDVNPLSKREILEYTGPLRKRAERSIVAHERAVTESRLTHKLINALPRTGEVLKSKRFALWQDVIGVEPKSNGEQQAKRRFDDCKRDLNNLYLPGMRACLQHYQAESMAELTRDVWKRIRPGS
jgi:hypothetical protein